MKVTILAAALASVLVLPTVTAANAAWKHHRHHARHWSAPYGWGAAPYQRYPNRPIWGTPGECYTDEGGGRFMPCNYGGGRN